MSARLSIVEGGGAIGAGRDLGVAPSGPVGTARGLDPADFDMRLRQLETPGECAALFARTIAPFGFDTFVSGEVDLADRSRSTFHVIHWPERWAHFYRTSGLVDHDPTIEALAVRSAPFTWAELRADPAFPRRGVRAMNLAAAAGWADGLVVPVRQARGRVGMVSLAGHRACKDGTERRYLTLISGCLHSHVRALVGRHGFALPPAGLTPRELETLRLVVLGMSDSTIGKALGIASTTAHEFVEKAKRKLKVRSRAELAALAVALAIVDV